MSIPHLLVGCFINFFLFSGQSFSLNVRLPFGNEYHWVPLSHFGSSVMHLAEVACSNQDSRVLKSLRGNCCLCVSPRQNYNSRIKVLNLVPGLDVNLRRLTKKCKTNNINFTESWWLSFFLGNVRFTFLLEELVEGSKLLVPVDSVFYPGRISTFNEPDLWVWFEKMLV